MRIVCSFCLGTFEQLDDNECAHHDSGSCKKKNTQPLFTERELEIAYCSGLLNQKELTIDKLSNQLKDEKFGMIMEFILSIRK